MIYVAYFILIFSAIQFLVALTNLTFIQKFENSEKEDFGLVSVLIPARNEEKNIGKLLADLQNQTYKKIEVLVFNDQSTDKTADIVKKHISEDKRIKIYNNSGLPKSWLGKNFACYQLAKRAKGKYFVFLDADVRVSEKLIINTINFTGKNKLELLSIFPTQKMQTFGEQITVPIMNFILLSLLPLILVRKSKFSSLSAGNGQFMFFKSDTYKKLQPHQKMRLSKVEDIEIARFYKKRKLKTACLTGKNEISCRMYSSYSEAINGFAKNIVTFFGGSYFVATFFWIITTFGFIPILLSEKFELILSYFFIIFLTRVFISIASRQNAVKNILFLPLQQISMGLFILKSITNKIRKKEEWKGRNLY